MELKRIIKSVAARCHHCAAVKPKTGPSSMGSLPLPLFTNQEVCIDLIYFSPETLPWRRHSPSTPSQASRINALFIMDALTRFVQVPIINKTDSEGVFRCFWASWVAPFGLPARITFDNDIRWSSSTSKMSKVLSDFGVDIHKTAPYHSQSNGRCERHIQELNKVLRLVQAQSSVALDFSDQLLLGITLLNGQPRPPTSFSSSELFNFGRCQWPDCVPAATGFGFQEQLTKAFKLVSDKLASERAFWMAKKNKTQARREDHLSPGCFVWVHHQRFPGYPRLKTDPIWLGPFRVEKVDGREVYVCWDRNIFRVEASQVKPWEGGELPSQSPPEIPTGIMSAEEMESQGFYLVEQILDYKKSGEEYLFLVLWQGYKEATWEPLENFVSFKADKTIKINEVFEKYIGTLDVRSDVYMDCSRKWSLRSGRATLGGDLWASLCSLYYLFFYVVAACIFMVLGQSSHGGLVLSCLILVLWTLFEAKWIRKCQDKPLIK